MSVSYGLCDLRPVIGGLEVLRVDNDGVRCAVTADEDDAELGLGFCR